MAESLIEDIKNDVLDHSIPLASALRKALVLAKKLKSEELERWVKAELEGYGQEKLPDYRVYAAHARCTVTNGVRTNQNFPIPGPLGNDQIERIVRTIHFRQSIAALSEICSAGSGKTDSMKFMLPEIVKTYITDNSNNDYQCIDAWQVVTVPALAGIIDMVRTRLLEFALKLEESYPDVQDIAAIGRDKRTISQIFNGCIMKAEKVQYFTDIKSSVIATDDAKVSNTTITYREGQSIAAALDEFKAHVSDVAAESRDEVNRSIDLLITALDDFTIPKSRLVQAVEMIAASGPWMKEKLTQLGAAAVLSGAERVGEATVKGAIAFCCGNSGQSPAE